MRARTPVAKLRTHLGNWNFGPTAPSIQPRFPSQLWLLFLFLQLKKYLKSHHCDNDEEVIAHLRRWCREQSCEFFADGVRQLLKRWRLCVHRDGEYIEKQSAKYIAETLSFRLTIVHVYAGKNEKVMTKRNLIFSLPSYILPSVHSMITVPELEP
ncbi:histone-lysine N-methyltransferase SETMAR [Elysia marginata]|uniref:Histone-lysine N-methyltransferase SETMAR n=1 Tax=Elysia marginata TaxID=1093978 RepID=A0AAV4IIJ0_9GAST|nr:histone-lysine N-methyltransferase SETMAR [Elysia marginata]